MIYGKIIRAVRKSRGLSQVELCSKLNITQASISMIESGVIQPSRETLEVFCYELDVPFFLLVFAATQKNDMSKEAWEQFKELAKTQDKILFDVLQMERDKFKTN